MVKKVISDESGRALVLTLVILGIGVLLLPTFLSHASTNLLATRVTEEGLKEQYAADAGVEHAIFRMSTGEYARGEESFNTPTLVNNLPVSVTITTVAEDVYKIVSEAGDTRIESYVCTNYSNLLWLLDNGITSAGDVTIQPGSTVAGDVMYGVEGVIDENEAERIAPHFEAIYDDSIGDRWPSDSELADFYRLDVDLDPYPDAIIDVGPGTEADPYIIPPLYYVGYGPDRLQIESTVNNAWAVLTGTVYVEGDLTIGGSKDFTLDLNSQTIYVEGEIVIGGKVTIVGSGCIIAEGDIFFEPKAMVSGPDDFVLVMSVNGWSKINPAGSFYGAVVGDAWVNLQPGNTLTWKSPYDKGLNFPNGSKGFMEIVTYRIY